MSVIDFFICLFLGIAALSLLISIFSKENKPVGVTILSLISALIVWSMI